MLKMLKCFLIQRVDKQTIALQSLIRGGTRGNVYQNVLQWFLHRGQLSFFAEICLNQSLWDVKADGAAWFLTPRRAAPRRVTRPQHTAWGFPVSIGVGRREEGGDTMLTLFFYRQLLFLNKTTTPLQRCVHFIGYRRQCSPYWTSVQSFDIGKSKNAVTS